MTKSKRETNKKKKKARSPVISSSESSDDVSSSDDGRQVKKSRRGEQKDRSSSKGQQKKSSKQSSAGGQTDARQLPEGKVKYTIRGRYALDEDQTVGQKILTAKGQPAEIVGTIYLTKTRSWLHTLLKKIVFLPDGMIPQQAIAAFTRLLPHKGPYVKGKVAGYQERSMDEHLVGLASLADNLGIRAEKLHPALFTQMDQDGIDKLSTKDTIGLVFQISRLLGLTADTSATSTATLQDFRQFFVDHDVDINSTKAPMKPGKAATKSDATVVHDSSDDEEQQVNTDTRTPSKRKKQVQLPSGKDKGNLPSHRPPPPQGSLFQQVDLNSRSLAQAFSNIADTMNSNRRTYTSTTTIDTSASKKTAGKSTGGATPPKDSMASDAQRLQQLMERNGLVMVSKDDAKKMGLQVKRKSPEPESPECKTPPHSVPLMSPTRQSPTRSASAKKAAQALLSQGKSDQTKSPPGAKTAKTSATSSLSASATKKKTMAEQATRIERLVLIELVPEGCNIDTTKDELDVLIASELTKKWSNQRELLKLLDQDWRQANPKGSANAKAYKEVIARGYRYRVWRNMFPNVTPPDAFWTTETGKQFTDPAVTATM